MKAGYAARDITPDPGITLSGFASRCNRPSEGVDDPISVHALAVEDGGEITLLVVFDLLALGPELTAELNAVLGGLDGRLEIRPVLCCTHTHSAPATIELIGCGIPDRNYWDRLIAAAREAGLAAVARMCTAKLRFQTVPVRGVAYNRRTVLEDGRVVMTRDPQAGVIKSGPAWERLLLCRLETEDGRGIAGIAHWAAHPCVVCSPNISADYPGELRRRLSLAEDIPFLFLQGAAGNVNLPFRRMVREEMLEDVDCVMEQLKVEPWPQAAQTSSVLADCPVRLHYASVPKEEELIALRAGMHEISATGSGPADVMAILANILNVEPGEQADPVMLRYIAGALGQWSDRILGQFGSLPATRELSAKVWNLGPLFFCFVAAEVFAETAIELQAAFPELCVTTVAYASPLVGYLPTDEALIEGGYEVDYAYRFYGHPAPFAKGSEPALVQTLQNTITRICTEKNGSTRKNPR
jgi:neutral ceramidase